MRYRGAMLPFTSSRLEMGDFSLAATRAWTIYANILVFESTQKGSIRLADLFLPAWAMCRRPAQNSRYHVLPLPCVAPAVKGSRRFCWKKQLHLRLRHDRGLHHFLLLGCFVFL